MKESTSQHAYVISIMSRDRVGIVFEISRALSEINGNIAQVRQSVLCGYFTMILLVKFPAKISQRAIEQKLTEVDAHSETALDFTVKPTEAPVPTCTDDDLTNAYVLTASGTDRIGFVATVSSFCMKHNLNILDLSTTMADGNYLMVILIDTNGVHSLAEIREDLMAFAREKDLRLVLQHYDIFKATNEINFPFRHHSAG